MSGTTNDKTRHDLDNEKLGRYLAERILSLSLPIISTKIGYGQSNPTYFIDDASGTRYILRKKPSGTIISPVAHQVDREYKVLKALGSVEGFPVPKVYCLCMDTEIIGTAFYVCQQTITELSTVVDIIPGDGIRQRTHNNRPESIYPIIRGSPARLVFCCFNLSLAAFDRSRFNWPARFRKENRLLQSTLQYLLSNRSSASESKRRQNWQGTWTGPP